MIKSAILLLVISVAIISVSGLRNNSQQYLKTKETSYTATAPEGAHYELTGSVDQKHQQFGMWLQKDSLQAFYFLSQVNDRYYTGHVQGVKRDYNVELIAQGPDTQQRFIGVGVNEKFQIIGAFSLDAQDSNGLRTGRAYFNFQKPKVIYYVDLHKSGDGIAYTVDKQQRRDVFGRVTTEMTDPDNFQIKFQVTPVYPVGGQQVIRCVQVFSGTQHNPLNGQEDCSKSQVSGGGSFYLSLEEALKSTPGFTTYQVTQLDDYSGLSKQDKQSFMSEYYASFSYDDGYDDGYDDYDDGY